MAGRNTWNAIRRWRQGKNKHEWPTGPFEGKGQPHLIHNRHNRHNRHNSGIGVPSFPKINLPPTVTPQIDHPPPVIPHIDPPPTGTLSFSTLPPDGEFMIMMEKYQRGEQDQSLLLGLAESLYEILSMNCGGPETQKEELKSLFFKIHNHLLDLNLSNRSADAEILIRIEALTLRRHLLQADSDEKSLLKCTPMQAVDNHDQESVETVDGQTRLSAEDIEFLHSLDWVEGEDQGEQLTVDEIAEFLDKVFAYVLKEAKNETTLDAILVCISKMIRWILKLKNQQEGSPG